MTSIHAIRRSAGMRMPAVVSSAIAALLFVQMPAPAAVWLPAPGHVQVPIRPGAVPDALPRPKPESVGLGPRRPWWPRADDVSRPTLTAYAPQAGNVGVAVVVFPGGGHLRAHEDEDRATGDPIRLELRPGIRATAGTAPTFLLQAENEEVDGVGQSLARCVALRQASAPLEMHLYAVGGHAFGPRACASPIAQWPRRLGTWLERIGMPGATAARRAPRAQSTRLVRPSRRRRAQPLSRVHGLRPGRPGTAAPARPWPGR